MSTLVDRLRGVLRGNVAAGESTPSDRPAQPAPAAARDVDVIGEVLDGIWHEQDGQRVLIVERRYPPGHCHGYISVADSLPPDEGWTRLPCLIGRRSTSGTAFCSMAPGRLLFLDLETTGLAGGAGTLAFLVGCGWFDGGSFRVRQFILPSLIAEPALLRAVADLSKTSAAIVTYNGKSFDLPLIETRFLFHRLAPAFAELPHLDMLHPARRLWRPAPDHDGPAGGSCRLSALEESLCGFRREDDVPGMEIPGRYFHFVRTGDPRPLAGVLEHNRLDLLTLAMLTARAAQLLDTGPHAAATAREALGLGQIYERAGLVEEASACFARAAGLGLRRFNSVGFAADESCRTVFDGESAVRVERSVQLEALRAYAALARSRRRHDLAATAWQQLMEWPECPPRLVREATEALAVHHEHRRRDPQAARRFALQSLPLQPTAARQQAMEHRLARLERKLARQEAGLFREEEWRC